MFTYFMRRFDLFGVVIGSTPRRVSQILHRSKQKAKEIQTRRSGHIYFHIIIDNNRSGDYFHDKSYLLFEYRSS